MITNNNKILTILTYLILLVNYSLFAQQIDTDNLLKEALHEANVEQNYPSALKKSQLGIKLAPDYLDFYLLSGRIYQITQKKDSARYYFNYVIDRNPKYEEAFLYLTNLNLEEKKYNEAEITINKALQNHPENKNFRYKKLLVYQLENNEQKEYDYVKTLELQYPNDAELKQRIFILETKNNSERIGINYSYTAFDRKNYGPWHLGSLQYIKQRNWGSLIGRVSYANRFASGESIIDGVQYEAESYLFTGKKSYSYLNAAYSEKTVFPKLKLGYSYFQNFSNGWEADLGIRYVKTLDADFTTAVVGVGKYIGSYWINLKSYIQSNNNSIYPAFTLTSRYYFDTQFDYLSLIAGYGSSPDERSTLGQYENRVSLNSYRIGGGYFKLINKHYLTGLQLTVNNQEYAPDLKQNEIEIALMFQYKL
ncbi:YaiO family outer membrane beta-barrel protein [Flavobacterium daejeonense]|uniref:YaiO family outer membrane beta-barrel protein n=1 Tax=Flavobacterium daejeonense TaxID=350893 RepID=UPI0005592319|nr:YaiO family outer membrane beta-barrel protein [Flavobacterium daejeonense]